MRFRSLSQDSTSVGNDRFRDSARLFTQATKSKDRVRFGLIGFRDHPDSDPDNEFVAKNFTPDLVSLDRFVDVIQEYGKAKAGGDLQEEMFRGVLDSPQNLYEALGRLEKLFR